MSYRNDTEKFGVGKLIPEYSKGKFSDPFLLPSSESMPTKLENALDLCLFLYYMNPQYRMASRRVVSHFMTTFEFGEKAGDKAERDEFETILYDVLDLPGALLEMGEEWACYGNSFWRIHFPFDRYLVDRRDGSLKEYSIDMFRNEDISFNLKDLTYTVPDPRVTDKLDQKGKRKTVTLPFRDRRSTDPQRIRVKKLDPRWIVLQHSWVSGKTRVIWRFEEWFKRQISNDFIWQINETPLSMLKALSKDEDYLFYEDEVFHFRSPTISGISNNGWGLPEVIANYRSLHQLQVYRKIDEAIGLDYLVPFRLFTPNISGDINDTSVHMLMAHWKQAIGDLIANRRRNPVHMQALPFPVNYQEFGAQGKVLTPKDLIEFQTNDMLDGFGYPAELFRGSLQVQQVPTALRMFERSFHFLHNGFDQFLKWTSRKVFDYLNWDNIEVSLALPSMANDIESKSHVYLQLAAGSEMSRETAYASWGISDPVREAAKRMKEDIEIEKERNKIQQDYEREMTVGSTTDIINAQMAEQQAAPAGGGAGAPLGQAAQQTTPLDIMAQAEEQAAQLLAIPHDGERRKALEQIKATNPNLHAAIKQKMEEIRSQGSSMGRQQVTEQLQQGGVM